MKSEKKILFASAAAFVALFFAAVFISTNAILSTNLLFLGAVILTIPYSIAKFFEFKKVKAYEKHLPNFLRDIAEAQRAGLSILQALQAVAKNDYGPLTTEIRKINNQLSWNIPLEKVLKDFAKRMGRSRMIARAIMIIDQSNKSGGNIESTMESLASHMEMIRDVQEEKSVLLNQQVILMYAIFFIFLGISVALLKFLIPLLQTQFSGTETLSLIEGFGSNPCSVCIGSEEASCLGCKLFLGVSQSFDFGKPEEPQAYYRALFFTMILVQGFFSGLMAGQIGSDSIVAGIKHSLIMSLSGFFIYIFVVKTGIA